MICTMTTVDVDRSREKMSMPWFQSGPLSIMVVYLMLLVGKLVNGFGNWSGPIM